jgi:transposase
MGYIQGTDRFQSRIMLLDDMVAKDSRARIIDKFVECLDLGQLGFANTTPSALGRNSCLPKTMAKLYVFGYERGVRSSRKLEALANTDIETMWLLGELKPNFKTIADFRKDNTEAFGALFCEFVDFAGICAGYTARLRWP